MTFSIECESVQVMREKTAMKTWKKKARKGSAIESTWFVTESESVKAALKKRRPRRQ